MSQGTPIPLFPATSLATAACLSPGERGRCGDASGKLSLTKQGPEADGASSSAFDEFGPWAGWEL